MSVAPKFSTTKPTLFWNKICPFVHRAWLAAVEKNIDFDLQYVPLGDGKPAWYTKEVNSRGTVPCLRLPDGKVIIESMFVAQYFDENYGVKGSLQAGTAVQKYQVRALITASGAAVSALYGLLMQPDETKQAAAKEKVVEKLGTVEQLYAKQSPNGPYFLGETFGLADIAFLPFLDRFRHTLRAYRGYELLENFPRLTKLIQAAETRPSFATTSQPGNFYVAGYKGYAKKEVSDKQGKLYINENCPFCVRVRIANLLKGSPFEEVEVSLPTPEWYNKEINPSEEVPALKLNDGTILTESVPLVSFIDECSGSIKLIGEESGNILEPAGADAAYETRFLLDEFNNSGDSLWAAMGGDAEAGDQTLNNLGHLESYYARQPGNGPYFLGAEPTLADCILLPFWVRVEALYELHLAKRPGAEGKSFEAAFPRLGKTVAAARADERFNSTLKDKQSFLDYMTKK